jgi:hypothetical protein
VLVDLEGDVAALGLAGVSATGVRAEMRQHLLAQGRGEVGYEVSD